MPSKHSLLVFFLLGAAALSSATSSLADHYQHPKGKGKEPPTIHKPPHGHILMEERAKEDHKLESPKEKCEKPPPHHKPPHGHHKPPKEKYEMALLKHNSPSDNDENPPPLHKPPHGHHKPPKEKYEWPEHKSPSDDGENPPPYHKPPRKLKALTKY